MLPRPVSQSGLTLGATLWSLTVAGFITYVLVAVAVAMDQRLRRQALAYEAAVIVNAVRAFQSDNAAALSGYATAGEVGWPDAANATVPCQEAITALAAASYLMGRYDVPGATSWPSAADPRLRWYADCSTDPQRFTLQLSSFGEDAVCSADPSQLATSCPDGPLALLIAAVTGGETIQEGDATFPGPNTAFTTTNRYVRWDIWRGAEHLALQRLGRELLWRNYDAGVAADVLLSISATSGIRFGGWNGFQADTPPDLARWIMGPNPGALTPGDVSDDFPPLAGPTLDGRSFAMFYRGANIDAFAITVPAFAITTPICPNPRPPPPAFVMPVWQGSAQSITIAFRGFNAASLLTQAVLLDATPGDDRETLIPIAWQVYDNGTATTYDPEIRVDVITVLPGIPSIIPIGSTTPANCPATVVQGTVDSAAVIFGTPNPGLVLGGGSIIRECFDIGTGLAVATTQSLPTIPQVDLGTYRTGGVSLPAVRLSIAAYCETSTDVL